MDLENVLHKEARRRKGHRLRVHVYEVFRVGKPIETERLVAARAMGVTANGSGVSFWKDGNVLKLVVMFAQLCEYTEKPLGQCYGPQ